MVILALFGGLANVATLFRPSTTVASRGGPLGPQG